MSMEQLQADVASLLKSQTAEADAATAAAAADAAGAAGEAGAGAGAGAGEAGAGAGEAGAGAGEAGAGDAGAAGTGEAGAAAGAGEAGAAAGAATGGLAKSFTIRLEDGSEMEAFDGEAMLKSFDDRLDGIEASNEKAVGMLVDLVKAQGEMLKAMNSRIDVLASAGRGRKSVVTQPAAPLHKSQPADGGNTQMTGQQTLQKCLSLQGSGRLTGLQVARAETAIRNGLAIPSDVAAVLAE